MVTSVNLIFKYDPIGMLTEENAYEIIKRILRDNPVEIFRLEERSGKKFN